jgi:hypothetical protein
LGSQPALGRQPSPLARSTKPTHSRNCAPGHPPRNQIGRFAPVVRGHQARLAKRTVLCLFSAGHHPKLAVPHFPCSSILLVLDTDGANSRAVASLRAKRHRRACENSSSCMQLRLAVTQKTPLASPPEKETKTCHVFWRPLTARRHSSMARHRTWSWTQRHYRPSHPVLNLGILMAQYSRRRSG